MHSGPAGAEVGVCFSREGEGESPRDRGTSTAPLRANVLRAVREYPIRKS